MTHHCGAGVGGGTGSLWAPDHLPPKPPMSTHLPPLFPFPAQPLLKQPRIIATHLFLNMERCGEEAGGPDGDIPKASEC